MDPTKELTIGESICIYENPTKDPTVIFCTTSSFLPMVATAQQRTVVLPTEI